MVVASNDFASPSSRSRDGVREALAINPWEGAGSLRPPEEEGILDRNRFTQEGLAACPQPGHCIPSLVERQNREAGPFHCAH
jgi:hypothetical protein